MISERMINHLIMQFSKSVNMQAFLIALGDELEELNKALDDLKNKRWIDTGSGIQLDNIGVLIDRSRYIAGAIQLEFFGFLDQPNTLTFGIGRFRDTTAVPYTASSVLDDVTYRPVLWHTVATAPPAGPPSLPLSSFPFLFPSPFFLFPSPFPSPFSLFLFLSLSLLPI